MYLHLLFYYLIVRNVFTYLMINSCLTIKNIVGPKSLPHNKMQEYLKEFSPMCCLKFPTGSTVSNT